MDSETSHRELAVWKAAIKLASKVYGATLDLPSDEPSGLAQQVRRAAAAIPTGIAEGCSRSNRKAFIDALRCAQRSLAELETHLLIAKQQRLLTDCDELLQDVVQLADQLTCRIRALSEHRVPEHHFRPMDAGPTTARRPQSP